MILQLYSAQQLLHVFLIEMLHFQLPAQKMANILETETKCSSHYLTLIFPLCGTTKFCITCSEICQESEKYNEDEQSKVGKNSTLMDEQTSQRLYGSKQESEATIHSRLNLYVFNQQN